MQDIKDRIQEVWSYEQEILDVFHKICIKHNLKYSLIFGTLLGAVRHKGFIPWDDDIDVIMPRGDYEKLLSIWETEAPKDYLIQNKRTDSDFTQNFSKIRKNNTTFIQDEVEKSKKYHTGFFIDIFPADRVAPKGFQRYMQYISNAINLLCAREFSSNSGGVINLVERLILLLPHRIRVRLFLRTERFVSKWECETNAEWYSPNTISVCKRYFASNLFDDLTMIEFNENKYCCVKDYENLLSVIYGDYMKLPPMEKRVWTHHPILIDFQHNYSEIKEEQVNRNEKI